MKREEVVTAQCDGLSLVDVKGYVTAIYGGHWWLAYVTDVIPADEKVQLNFLHPHGPSPPYFYLRHSDTLCVHESDILTRVNPTTDTGRTYMISKEPEDTEKLKRPCKECEYVKRDTTACKYTHFIIRQTFSMLFM